MDWDMVEAVSTAVACVILVVGVPFAVIELRHNRENAKRQALADLFQLWGDRDEREARRFILRNETTPEMARLMYDAEEGAYVEQRKRVEATLTLCDRISYMVEKNVIPEQDVYETAGRTMVKLWDSLQTYVAVARIRSPEQGASFERLVTKYRAKLGAAPAVAASHPNGAL